MPKNGRSRAWVLVKVKPTKERKISTIAEEIYDTGLIGNESGVTRVDIVTGPYDLVVPVDAETKSDLLTLVEDKILGTEGVESTLTLFTIKHEPEKLHRTRGFEETTSNPRIQIRNDNVWG
jgi:DNA-binding Lrp family transcriptional regulator